MSPSWKRDSGINALESSVPSWFDYDNGTAGSTSTWPTTSSYDDGNGSAEILGPLQGVARSTELRRRARRRCTATTETARSPTSRKQAGVFRSSLGRAMSVIAAPTFDNDGCLGIFVTNDAMAELLLGSTVGDGTFVRHGPSRRDLAYGENGQNVRRRNGAGRRRHRSTMATWTCSFRT